MVQSFQAKKAWKQASNHSKWAHCENSVVIGALSTLVPSQQQPLASQDVLRSRVASQDLGDHVVRHAVQLSVLQCHKPMCEWTFRFAVDPHLLAQHFSVQDYA